MADKVDNIFISEILADNAGTGAIDTDGDGNTNKADEFIELQNTGSSALSLDGFEVWSQQNGLLHSFGPGDSIPAGGNATIVGNYDGTPPAGFFSAGIAESGNFLQDGEGSHWDNIFLVNSITGEYVVISYGSPPQPVVPPPGFPGTTQNGSGESISSDAPNGTAFARDADGNLVETTPDPGTPEVPCFARGTLLATPNGFVPVEDLLPGQSLVTLDHGSQPILAIRRVSFSRFDLLRHPSLRPIEFMTCAPALQLSPSHRLLLSDGRLEMLFGNGEMLANAGAFIGNGGTRVLPVAQPVTYFHVLMERHEILLANGIWTESLFRGDVMERALLDRQSWITASGFSFSQLSHDAPARPILRRFELDVLTRMRGSQLSTVPAHAA